MYKAFVRVCFWAFAALFALDASAATYWGGYGENSNWMTAGNWVTNSAGERVESNTSTNDNLYFRGNIAKGSWKSLLTIDEDIVTARSTINMQIADESNPFVFKNNASYTSTKNDSFKIGDNTYTAGVMLEGGVFNIVNMTVGGNATGKTGYIFLNDTQLNLTGNMYVNNGKVESAGSETSLSQLLIGNMENTSASYYHKSGTLTVKGNFQMGVTSKSGTTAYFEISGGVVKNTGGNLYLGNTGIAGCSSTMKVLPGGRYESQERAVHVGMRSNASLLVEGGEVVLGNALTFCQNADCQAGETVLVKVCDGGLLQVRNFTYGSGAGDASLVLDGGTLRAAADYATFIPAAARLSVQIGESGGTVDSAGHDITIAEDLEAASGSTGGLKFAGGGTVRLSGAVSYAGATTVEAGTTLVVPAPIAGSKLAFALPSGGLADGTYTAIVISGEGTFSAADIAAAAKAEGLTLALSGDGKTIYCVKGVPEQVYIGANGGNLSVASNWLTGAVPTGGKAVIDASAALSLAVGDTFEPDTIEFRNAGSAAVSVSGDLHVKGSLTNASCLAIASGSSLTVDGDLVLYFSGAAATKTFLHSNEGFVTVKGKAIANSRESISATTKANVYQYAVASSKPISAAGISYESGSNWQQYFRLGPQSAGSAEWIVGSQGLQFPNSRQANYSTFSLDGKDVTLRCAADWTLANSGRPGSSHGDIYLENPATLTIDTADATDGATPRTVTLNGRIYSNANNRADPAVVVKGTGAVIVNTTGSNANLTDEQRNTSIQTSIAVRDTATLAVNAGKEIYSGTVKVAAGATFAAPQAGAGTATVDALALEAGSTIAVSNLAAGVPAISLKGALTLPEEGTVAVEVDGDAPLADGFYTILSAGSNLSEDILDCLALDASAVAQSASLYVKGGSLILIAGVAEIGNGIWVGGKDLNLATADNWLNGVVPVAGDVLNFSSVSSATTLNADFGDNRVFATATFGAGVVTLAGDLHLGVLSNAWNLAVAEGGSLAIDGDLVGYAANNTRALLHSNRGSVTVGGTVHFRSSSLVNRAVSTVSQYVTADASSSPIAANGLAYNADSWSDYLVANLGSMGNGPGKWVVGAGGLSIPSTRQITFSGFRVTSGQNVEIHPAADWTLANSRKSATQNGDMLVANGGTLEIATSDYSDNTVPRTVTLVGRLHVEGAATVSGCGTVVVNTTGSHSSLTEEEQNTVVAAGKTLAITGTATLQVNAGRKILGAGSISLAAGTSLAFPLDADRTLSVREIEPAITLPAEGVTTLRIEGAGRWLKRGEWKLLETAPEGWEDHLALGGSAVHPGAKLAEKDGALVVEAQAYGLNVILR